MNDERPIEKLLRRYAQKRGDEAGAPPELHPATRRMLQSEVARQFPKPASERQPSTTDFFSLLTRRWIYAVGIFVVLGLAAAMLMPSLNKSKSSTMLAQKAASEDIVVRESLAPTAAPTPVMPAEAQPTLAVASDRRNQPLSEPSGGGNNVRLRDESATLNYSVTNAVAAGSLARFDDVKLDADGLRQSEEAKQVSLGMKPDSATPASRALSAQPPARFGGGDKPADSLTIAESAKASRTASRIATTAVSESRLAAAPAVSSTLSDKGFVTRGDGLEKDFERAYAQSYANVVPEQLQAKAAKVKAETPIVPVLANFQVQNVGNEVRVIDSDGSTYRGVVSAEVAGQTGAAPGKPAEANFERADLRRAQTASEAAIANQQGTQNYLWRVEGTNRTLNQNVVFTWNFVNPTNALAASQTKTISGALTQDASKLPSQFPMMLQNSIINGRAQLGPAQQTEVNAVPVKP
ncbi:MAG: hypothetical protein U1F83_06485 [Verrucomicrobiota bacterium]